MIALDLDNTTLRTDKSLSSRTKTALKKAQEQGIQVVISTGRVFSALPDAILEFDGIQYMINSNGAVITEFPQNEKIYTNYLEEESVSKIEAVLRRFDDPVEVFADGKAYADASVLDDLRLHGSDTRNVQYILWSRRPVKDVYAVLQKESSHIENVSITFENQEERLRVKNALLQIPDITVTSSERHCLEIGGKTTSKAEALRFLMQKLGIHREELMACGDSPNDEKMIRLAGIGVVMENGTENMKSIADFVTDTNDRDGVAKAVERFALR